MSRVEILCAAMNQKDASLVKKMNIQSDAIICNQCDHTSNEVYDYGEYKVRYLNFEERGVGLNRNNALMRATGDICVLADDDMRFHDKYVETVEQVYAQNRDADMIIFNIDEAGESSRRVNNQVKRINLLNYMNYGAARLSFRRSAVTYKGISFNLNFGGGTAHNAGEDTLFIRDCLKAGLKVIAVPVSIAELMENSESTWFKGYDEKYFFDKGIVLALAHPVLARLMAVYMAYSYGKSGKTGMKDAIKAINRGISFVNSKEYIKRD